MNRSGRRSCLLPARSVARTPESLHHGIRQQERDTGQRPGTTSAAADRVKELEREVCERKKANKILRLASAYFAQAELDRHIKSYRPSSVPIGTTRGAPICHVLQVAPSAYHQQTARKTNLALHSKRAVRDEQPSGDIERAWQANHHVYGVAKIWRQLKREGQNVACCTIERLMKQVGLRGVTRSKAGRTTQTDPAVPCPRDHVNRQFVAEWPNQQWVSDFTYVSTWQGFVYVAFVVDVFSRYIVGWRISRSMQTEFVLDALEQALWVRQLSWGGMR